MTERSGVSVSAQIFDNPFPSTHSSSFSQSTQPAASSKPSHSIDLKQLTYRALMLKGMACRPMELQPFLPSQQATAMPITCDEAREIVRSVVSGSIIDYDDVNTSVNSALQHLALAQV